MLTAKEMREVGINKRLLMIETTIMNNSEYFGVRFDILYDNEINKLRQHGFIVQGPNTETSYYFVKW